MYNQGIVYKRFNYQLIVMNSLYLFMIMQLHMSMDRQQRKTQDLKFDCKGRCKLQLCLRRWGISTPILVWILTERHLSPSIESRAQAHLIYLSIYLTSLRVLVPVGADARGSIPAIFIVGVGRLVLLLPLFGSNSQGRYGSDPFLYPESSEC
jgi:hypothetical protein